jgi:type I restriction enzyme S subunit
MSTTTNWTIKTLDELAERIDYGHTASADRAEVGPKFLRITDIQNGHVDWNTVPHCPATPDELDKYRLRDGDIVFARTGNTTGKSFHLKEPPQDAVFASYLIRVRPSRSVDSRFLAHFFDTPNYWNQIEKNAQGAGQPGVNATRLKTLEIPLPPLPEQKRIADILDKADAIRRKRQEAIKEFQGLQNSAFFEMFGDPRKNPFSLPSIPLMKLLKLKSGDFLPQREMDLDGPYAVYGGNGISGRHSKFMFDQPKIVIGRVGAYCGVVHITEPKSWITDNALFVAEKDEALTDRYLAEALRLSNLNQYASRSGQPLISGSRIYPVEILVPPVEQQIQFARIAGDLTLAESKLTTMESETTKLFNSLTQVAFKGDL